MLPENAHLAHSEVAYRVVVQTYFLMAKQTKKLRRKAEKKAQQADPSHASDREKGNTRDSTKSGKRKRKRERLLSRASLVTPNFFFGNALRLFFPFFFFFST